MNDDLKSRFDELRAYERTQIPSFDDVVRHAPRVHKRSHAIAIAAAALAAAIAGVMLWPRPMKDDVAPLSITQWRAPTDFLLDVPHGELVSELPKLNESVVNLEAL